MSLFHQLWNRKNADPQDSVLKTWNQFKETLLDESAAISVFSKILKALVLQAAVKVSNIREFQSRRVLLFVFLLGSFSGLSCRCYALNMDPFIPFSWDAPQTRQERWESVLHTSVSPSQTAPALQQGRQSQNYLVPQPAGKTEANTECKKTQNKTPPTAILPMSKGRLLCKRGRHEKQVADDTPSTTHERLIYQADLSKLLKKVFFILSSFVNYIPFYTSTLRSRLKSAVRKMLVLRLSLGAWMTGCSTLRNQHF